MPSVSISNTPNVWSPVNKELWFRVNSASSSTTDFKYMFKVQKKNEPFISTSWTTLPTYKMPPRPDGYGLYSPHKLLKSYIGYDKNPFASGFVASTDALVQYQTAYGFQYNPNLRWNAVDNLTGNLGLLFTSPHDLMVGDIITIDKDNKTINPSYDGTASVLQVVNTTEIKTSKPYGYNPNTTQVLSPWNSYTQNAGSLTLSMLATNQSSGFFNLIATNATSNRYRTITVNTDTILGQPVPGQVYSLSWECTSGALNGDLHCWAGVNGGFFVSGSRASDFVIPSGTGVGASGTILFLWGGTTTGQMYFQLGTMQVQTSFNLKMTVKKEIMVAEETGYVNNVQRWSGTASGLYTWNGTRQYDERATDFGTIYPLTASTSKFLTNWKGEKKTNWAGFNQGEYETLSMILPYVNGSSGTSGYSAKYQIYDDNGVLQQTYTTNNTASAYQRVELGVGSQNVSNLFHFNWSSNPTWTNYKVTVLYNGVTASETKSYRLTDICSIYDKDKWVRLMWQNREGGWDYYNFVKDNKKSVDISRSEFSKVLNWDYEKGDRGSVQYATKVNETYTAQTDWVSEYEAEVLAELFTSPEVYIITNTNEINYSDDLSAYILPIIITDNKYDYKTTLRDKLFNISINYKMAYDVNIQNH